MSLTGVELDSKFLSFQDAYEPLCIRTRPVAVEKREDGSIGVGPHKILVKVHSAALNPSDLMLYRSVKAPITYFWRGPKGLARDFSGTVAAIGDEAAKKTDFCVGDRIAGMHLWPFGEGTVSEYITLDIRWVGDNCRTLVPPNVNMHEAAAWPLVFGTAFQMIEGRVKDNKIDKALVIGGGTSVGRFCIQLLRGYFGAREIVTTCSSTSAELVKELGASSTIDYTRFSSVLQPVKEAARTGKFDLILDCCGNGDLLNDIPLVMKVKPESSYYVSIAGDSKFDYKSVSWNNKFGASLKNYWRIFRSLVGILPYNYTLFIMRPSQDWTSVAYDLISENKVKIHVDSVYLLDQFQDAIDRLESNQARGKVVIQVVES